MCEMQTFTNSWSSHRKALVQLVEQAGDEDLSFKPWDGAMTFAELVVHIVGSTHMFASIVSGKEQPADESPTVGSADELRKLVQDLTKSTQEMLEAITEDQLDRTVQFASMSMSGKAMLEMAKEHEIHHKGQLFTYARICGIKDLPFFVIRG